MVQENVEVVRSMYAGFNGLAKGGDIASYVTAHFDADCEYQPVEEIDAIRGQDALISWNQRWFEAWDEFGAELDEVIDAGDDIVAVITVRGRGRESGMSITQRIFHVFEVRDGKILRLHEYLERERAVEAAGLGE